MYFYMVIEVIFYSKLFQNTHQSASIVKRFQQFLHEKFENYPIASVYLYKKLHFLKKLYKKNKNFENFIIKNGNFCNFLNTKSDPNIYQNAPNCTI